MSQENVEVVRGVRTPVVAFGDAELDLGMEGEKESADRLLACGRASGHGNLSGVPISGAIFQLFTLKRGLVIR